MMLEMYLNGQLVDTTTPIPDLWQTKSNEYLKSLVAELEKKHADLLKKSTGKPCYLLSGVQSCINGFTPLRHPASSALKSHVVETTAQLPAKAPLKSIEKAETVISVTTENIQLNQTKRVA